MVADVSHLKKMYARGLTVRHEAMGAQELHALLRRTRSARVWPSPSPTQVYLRGEDPSQKGLFTAIQSAAESHALEVKGITVETGKRGPRLIDAAALLSLLRICADGEIETLVVDGIRGLGRHDSVIPILELLQQIHVRLFVLSTGSGIRPEGEFYPLDQDPFVWSLSMRRSEVCPVCGGTIRPKRKDSEHR